LLVDFSSLEPTATREMAAELAGRTGMAWLDSPVSGGVVGAEAGSLAIMVGGAVTDLDRCARCCSASVSVSRTWAASAPGR
jgi:3-hydroxyisobutyrate dehydrogenase